MIDVKDLLLQSQLESEVESDDSHHHDEGHHHSHPKHSRRQQRINPSGKSSRTLKSAAESTGNLMANGKDDEHTYSRIVSATIPDKTSDTIKHIKRSVSSHHHH